MTTTARYVYGVVRAGTVGGVTAQGVSGDRGVHLVAEGDLGAIVSDVPDGPLTGTKDDVLAHSRVLEEVVANTTVLPMRFGVVLASEEAVRTDLLERYGDELRDLLASMDGHVQMRVRAFYAGDAGLAEVVSENPPIAQLSESLRGRPADATYYDRIRLGEMIAAALDEKCERDAGRLLDRLEPLAEDVHTEPRVHEQMLMDASLLMRRDRVDELGAAIERLQEEGTGRVQLRAVGPLPPYSFVDLPYLQPEEAWA